MTKVLAYGRMSANEGQNVSPATSTARPSAPCTGSPPGLGTAAGGASICAQLSIDDITGAAKVATGDACGDLTGAPRVSVASLTVTATNTLSAHPQPCDGVACGLDVDGVVVTDHDADAPFTVSGTHVVRNAASAGYPLLASYVVTSECTY